MAQLITAAAITANNEPIGIVPNTFSYEDGLGEAVVKAQSTGGLGVTNAVGINVETLKGKGGFELYPTVENLNKVRQWKINLAGNVFTASDDVTQFTRTFQQAVVINSPENNIGADGIISIEFESAPAV